MAGISKGHCKIVRVHADKHIRLHPIGTGYMVSSFEACFTIKGAIRCFKENSDSLSTALMNELLLEVDKKTTTLAIEKIKAISLKGDTIRLNTIVLNLER